MGVYCEINFTQCPQHIYYQNSTVSGQIKYTLIKEEIFKKITVSLKGVGVVRFEQRNRKTTSVYTKKEDYIKIDNFIFDLKKELPAGVYETNFEFLLPPNIPASLKYQRDHGNYVVYCKIKYYIAVKFIRSGLTKFHLTFKKEINVLSGITPILQTVRVIFGEKKKLFSVLNSSEVFIKATMEKCVYKSGEVIKLNYEVINNSNVTIKSVETKLVELYTFLDNYKPLNEIPSAETKTGAIKRGETSVMDIELMIPEDKFSLENSKIVKRDYAVFIIAALPIPHRNALLKVPVQIGEPNSEIDIACEDSEEPPSYWESMEEVDVKKEKY